MLRETQAVCKCARCRAKSALVVARSSFGTPWTAKVPKTKAHDPKIQGLSRISVWVLNSEVPLECF